MAIRTVTAEVVWRVIALATPAAHRHCHHCGQERPFRSSDKFRVNAQGRRLSAWLIYRCDVCQETWNLPLGDRLRVSDLEPRRYQALLVNDRRLAWRLAFDRARVTAAGARPSADVAYRVEGAALDEAGRHGAARWRIRIVSEDPCGVRLDKLLAGHLGVARKQIVGWARGGRLTCEAGRKLKPSRRLRDELTVILRASKSETTVL